MVNITKETEDYIRAHPFVRQAIKNNIVNYSKLARSISRSTGIKNLDAILIAARRYYQKLSKKQEPFPIVKLLKESKISIKNKVAVVILEPETKHDHILDLQKVIQEKNETLHVIRGSSATTLITTEDFLAYIEKSFKLKILKISKDCVEINIKSSDKLESVPGVMGHLYSLFGENQINILETMSCWTDTLFVIRKQDLEKAMKLLSF